MGRRWVSRKKQKTEAAPTRWSPATGAPTTRTTATARPRPRVRGRSTSTRRRASPTGTTRRPSGRRGTTRRPRRARARARAGAGAGAGGRARAAAGPRAAAARLPSPRKRARRDQRQDRQVALRPRRGGAGAARLRVRSAASSSSMWHCWLLRAVRDTHRYAIEQTSCRLRGGRRDDARSGRESPADAQVLEYRRARRRASQGALRGVPRARRARAGTTSWARSRSAPSSRATPTGTAAR